MSLVKLFPLQNKKKTVGVNRVVVLERKIHEYSYKINQAISCISQLMTIVINVRKCRWQMHLLPWQPPKGFVSDVNLLPTIFKATVTLMLISILSVVDRHKQNVSLHLIVTLYFLVILACCVIIIGTYTTSNPKKKQVSGTVYKYISLYQIKTVNTCVLYRFQFESLSNSTKYASFSNKQLSVS